MRKDTERDLDERTFSDSLADLNAIPKSIRENRRFLKALGIGAIKRFFGFARLFPMKEDELVDAILRFDSSLGSIEAAREAIPRYVGRDIYTGQHISGGGVIIADTPYKIIPMKIEPGNTIYRIVGDNRS